MSDDFERERRRLRRRVWFWRIVAGIAVAVIAVAWLRGDGPSGPYVARYALEGVILDDPERDRLMRDLSEDAQVRALILRINSPGGSTAGSEALYESLRGVAGKKPVVAVMGEAAASGGYIAALAAEHIVARGNTITGSIGVIAQYPEVGELLDSIGVTMREVKSSPLKAAPSPFGPPSEAALEMERAIVEDAYRWFRGLVGDRRGLEGAGLDLVADGRVFTGRQALDAGLVDAIGGEEAAREWLAGKGVESALPAVEVEVRRDEPSLLDLIAALLDGDARGAAAALWPGAAPGPRLLSVLR